VLKELVLAGEEGMYLREIARRADLDPTGVSRELVNLAASGIVSTRQIGNQKHFVLNPHCPIFMELKMIILKTVGLADEIKTALEPLASRINVAYIYGSIASGTERFDSDIDIMVVGSVTLREITGLISKVGRKLSREINATTMSVSEYKKKMKEPDSFVSRIHNGPKMMLIGEDNDA
jgi:predicted nucleotidyltransferase